jgi:hypothetical protein
MQYLALFIPRFQTTFLTTLVLVKSNKKISRSDAILEINYHGDHRRHCHSPRYNSKGSFPSFPFRHGSEQERGYSLLGKFKICRAAFYNQTFPTGIPKFSSTCISGSGSFVIYNPNRDGAGAICKEDVRPEKCLLWHLSCQIDSPSRNFPKKSFSHPLLPSLKFPP